MGKIILRSTQMKQSAFDIFSQNISSIIVFLLLLNFAGCADIPENVDVRKPLKAFVKS